MGNKFKYVKNQSSVFVVILGVSLFLILPQILNHSLVLGADSLFHFNRIYDIYMQFKTGNFSYFQSNYGFQQSGRIVNALYGPGFAYLLGGLLLIVHSWIKFQIISSFFIFVISGYSMYFLSREMASTKKVSLLMSILFMSSMWITRWSLSQNFMAWGIALMPLIVLMGLKMIKDNADGLKIIPLAIIVSLMIQVHLLSALMSVGVLFFFFMIGFFQTNKKWQLLLKCFFAGLLSLVLTFNVWGGMLDVFSTNKLYPPYANLNMSNSTTNLSMNNATITQIGLFMSLIFVLQIIWLFKKNNSLTLANKTTTVLGLIFLILSSSIIPWTVLGNAIPEFQRFLQFPFRFEGFASVLLLSGFGASISTFSVKENRKFFELILVVSGIFIVIQSYSDIQKNNEVWNSDHSVISTVNVDIPDTVINKQITQTFTSPYLESGLKLVTKASPDYLPNNRVLSEHSYYDYRQNIINNKSNVSRVVKKNGDLVLCWSAKEKGQLISLPVVVYNNSDVQLNGVSLDSKKITLSTIGTPAVRATKKGTNTFVLSYHSKIITKVRLMIVILVWIISLIILFLSFINKKIMDPFRSSYENKK
ncbi:MFS transporter [Dellaglioa sp. BT-FLS60]